MNISLVTVLDYHLHMWVKCYPVYIASMWLGSYRVDVHITSSILHADVTTFCAYYQSIGATWMPSYTCRHTLQMRDI